MAYSFSGIAAATFGNVTDATGTGNAQKIYTRFTQNGEIYNTIYTGDTESMLFNDAGNNFLFPVLPVGTITYNIDIGNGDLLAVDNTDLLEA